MSESVYVVPTLQVQKAIPLLTASHALMGYCDLPVGTVITKEWSERLHDYYLKNMKEALDAAI